MKQNTLEEGLFVPFEILQPILQITQPIKLLCLCIRTKHIAGRLKYQKVAKNIFLRFVLFLDLEYNKAGWGKSSFTIAHMENNTIIKIQE